MALGKGYKNMLGIDESEESNTSEKSVSKSKNTSRSTNSSKTKASSSKTKAETDKKSSVTGEILLKINDIEPNKLQPRKDFNEDALADLADSIKKYGVI